MQAGVGVAVTAVFAGGSFRRRDGKGGYRQFDDQGVGSARRESARHPLVSGVAVAEPHEFGGARGGVGLARGNLGDGLFTTRKGLLTPLRPFTAEGSSSLREFDRVGADSADRFRDGIHVRARAEKHGLGEPDRFFAKPIIFYF